MSNSSIVVALVGLGVLLAGCTPRDVILDVDGRKLTASERDEELGLRIKLFRMSDPDVSEAVVDGYRKTLLDSLERHFVDETVLLKFARERKQTVTRDEIAQRMDGFTRFFDRLSGAEQTLAKAIAQREILCEKAKQSIIAAIPDKVSPAELDQALNRLKNYEEMVAATNREIYAHATNVWHEVCGGRDFAEAARLYSEADDQSSCEWGQFPLEAFAEEPDLRYVVGRMKIGDISYPVEGDNGLMIVRLKGIDRLALPPRYDLDRIFFKLPEIAPQMTVGEVAKLISTEKQRVGFDARLKELRQKVRVIHH